MTNTIAKVIEDIECEGFHYAFHHYSNYDDVEDERFQNLRKAYIKASEDLCSYLSQFDSEVSL